MEDTFFFEVGCREREEGLFGNSRLKWKSHDILDVILGDIFVEVLIDCDEVDIVRKDGEFCGK